MDKLVKHSREDGAQGVGRQALHLAGTWLLSCQASLGADGGPALSYELVFVAPVLQILIVNSFRNILCNSFQQYSRVVNINNSLCSNAHLHGHARVDAHLL